MKSQEGVEMNDLEKAIAKGLQSTFKEYEEMSDYWLSHAPEYFITVGVARAIYKHSGNAVFMDVSLKRIYSHRKMQGEPIVRGKPPEYLSIRPDISVWYKASERVRAAIEVKRAYNINPIQSDVQRMRRVVGQSYGPAVGYVIAYSEAKSLKSKLGHETLSTRFDNWANATDTRMTAMKFGGPDDDGWWWGWCILRVDG